MSNPVVQLAALHKSFGREAVLQGVNWSIAPGTIVGLLGRNGAGKSTLIECLLGLREADAGSCTLYGEAVASLSDRVRANIGYVPQKSELFEWMTPHQMLDYFKALYPRWNSDKVAGLLSRWGFGETACNKPISKLSGGEKQRLSIIRALAHEPRLLVLDEPVASLDPVGRRDFLHELVNDVIERDTTVIFSTHILSDLERVALDVAFLQDGRITLQGALDELLESTMRISGSSTAMASLPLSQAIRRHDHADGSMTVLARLTVAEDEQLRARTDIKVDTLSLEDLFVEVTR